MPHRRRWPLAALLALASSAGPAWAAAPTGSLTCAEGLPLRAHFYDVGQAASALVELPDGRAVVVDVGGLRTSVSRKLEADLRGRPISLLWITHPHDDHLSHAKAVLKDHVVEQWADNGLDGGSPSRRSAEGLGARARAAARQRGVPTSVVSPASPAVPLTDAQTALTFSAILPPVWSSACRTGDANDCSIGLRIDYCKSSILFLGDAEEKEEQVLRGLTPVTLLVVPHHGSSTSTSDQLLRKTRPTYAVISVGAPPNAYCHPAASTVERLNRILGGARTSTIPAYQVDRCTTSERGLPRRVERSERLWSTASDGEVTLVTTGDGAFRRE